MNRVWIFVIPTPLGENKLAELKEKGNEFVKGWTAHEKSLSASFEIFQHRIIIVKVNEDVHGASGCSIDKLTRFMKECSAWLSVDLMDRLQVAYESDGKVEVVRSNYISGLLQAGKITPDTTIYNTAASNETELANWKQPLRSTWLNKYLSHA
jgi:hypothetical protein